MESLQHAWNDLARRLRELPKRTQILIATVTVLCVAAFVLFNQSGDQNSEVDLLPGTSLTVRQLSTYQIAFADAGLAEYRIEKQKIFVLKTKKADFMVALSKANLLTKASGKYLEKALDSSSPFENQHQRKQRIKIAQEKEFAQTISQFNGIEEATVQYDAEEKKGIRQETRYTASVTVRAKNNKRLTVHQGQVIKNYLAGCIAGLETEKIYIVDLNQSLEPPVAATKTLNFPLEQRLVQNETGRPPIHTERSRQSSPFTTGTLAIVGSALIAGCVALLRRRNIATEDPITSSPILDIEFAGQPTENDQTPISEMPFEHSPLDVKNDFPDDGSSKARLLLAGQSDYSHLVPDQQTDGIELTTIAVNSGLEAPQTPHGAVAEDGKLPFDFVNQANSDDLFEILVHEGPQVIAIVFSHLAPEQSAHILSRLPEATQIQVLKSLGNLAVPSKDTTREIGKTLAKRLALIMKRNEKRKAGVQAVGDLLEHVDAQQRSQLLERLQNQDADLTSHIATSTKDPVAKTNLDKETIHEKSGLKKQRPKIFQKTVAEETPAIIKQMSGEDLCTLFAAVDPRDAVLALSHWDTNVTQTLTHSMQSKDVLRLEKSLRNTRGQNVHKSTSCRKILEVAQRLIDSGQIPATSSA